jgi:glutathione S-transferase
MQYQTITEAKSLPGTRLILTAGVPGPWSEAAKAVFKVRQVQYTPIAQELGGANDAQVAWLGIRNAPVAVHNDEPPRSGWADILFLAERIGKGPSLLPADAAERALMLGLAHEVAGENGLGWTRRLMLVHGPIQEGPSSPAYNFSKFFGDNYGYSPAAGAAAVQRTIDILAMLSSQIERQKAAGKSYLVGNSLSALDLYWATFANLIDPLPHELCPMNADFRHMYGNSPPTVRAAASPALLAHRDFICKSAVGLPFEF